MKKRKIYKPSKPFNNRARRLRMIKRVNKKVQLRRQHFNNSELCTTETIAATLQ